MPGCEEEQVECLLCLTMYGETRYGHLHYFVHPFSIDLKNDKCLIQDWCIHCHFAFRHGTIAPALDEARNVRCLVKEHWEKYSEWCEIKHQVKKRKRKPQWLHDEWGFWWLFGGSGIH